MMLVTMLSVSDSKATLAVDPKRVLAVVENGDTGRIEIVMDSGQRISVSGDLSLNEIVFKLNNCLLG